MNKVEVRSLVRDMIRIFMLLNKRPINRAYSSELTFFHALPACMAPLRLMKAYLKQMSSLFVLYTFVTEALLHCM